MHRLVYLESGLSFGPVIIQRLIARIDPSRYDEHPEPDRFSLREAAAHLADLEPVFQRRMNLALANPGAEVENFDQNARAIAMGYSSWDMSESLAKFAEERRKTLELFRSISADDQKKTVRHPILGEISILDLAVFALGHDAYHIEQISAY